MNILKLKDYLDSDMDVWFDDEGDLYIKRWMGGYTDESVTHIIRKTDVSVLKEFLKKPSKFTNKRKWRDSDE